MSPPLDDPRWRGGMELLRRGAWLEAHELIEELWRELPESPLRVALQGAIQAAVALEHLRRGNPVGADKVWQRARGRWASLDAWPLGEELASWAEALLEFMQGLDLERRAAAARGGRAALPLPPEADWPRPTGDA